MDRIVTRVAPKDRLEQAKARLSSLCDGSTAKLEKLRTPENGADVAVRAEVAYLLRTIALLKKGRNLPVEVVIAGRTTDTNRRIAAYISRLEDRNGLMWDAYTGQSSRVFEPIPITIEAERPTRRKSVKKEPLHA